MPFPHEIQSALNAYDDCQGPIERLFRDHPAIQKLKRLPDDHREILFKIAQCFIGHIPSRRKASYPVYTTVLRMINPNVSFQEIEFAFALLSKERLLSETILDALRRV